MKKVFLSLMAATMLFTTSCQQQELTPALGEATVTFEVATPEIATRAYSDGSTANQLQYAVYHMINGTEYGTISHKTTDAEIHGTTTLSLQLTAGETYQIILWAAAEGAPYAVDFEDKTMIVDYTNVVSNNESLDAFYAVHKFTVNGAQTETVDLRRPFAQLNIGTNDYAKAVAASGYVPTQSSVTVKGIYNTLNLADGTVTGLVNVPFGLADIDKTEVFPYEDATYDYVAMNYVLVEGKSLVDVEFTLTDGTTSKTRTVSSVPVQRNYRTNIYGSLLTSDVDVNVEIKPGYNEPANELDDLYKAALNGGEVTLTEDVVLTSPLEVVGDMTINLNGKTVSGNMHKSVGPVIKNNGTLTINGGTISSLANNGGSAIANYGTLTVEDVTIHGAPREGDSWPAYPINNYGSMTLTDAVIDGYQGCVALNAAGTTVLNNCELTKNYEKTSSHVFYVNHADAKVFVNGGTYNHNGFDGSLAYVNKGDVTINDGTFNAKDGGYGFAVLSGGKVIINGGNINAGLLNWGGQFEVYGGVYNSKPQDNHLATGHKTVKIDGLYHVLPEDVANAAETAGVTSVTESTADVATALATNNGEATMFMWNDVAYIAKYQEVVIVSSADEATTVRGVVESATGLEKATVAEGIEVVGNRTFRKCANLETVQLPNSLTEIGPAVFQSCSKLDNVTIPASVTTIGEGAFAECTSLTSINIPVGITRLEKDVLRNTGLVSIEIPASVNYIGTYAFRDCESLTEVKILSPEFTIEDNTFTNMAAPVPTMTIKVVNAEMKAYLESKLSNYDKSYITVVVM